MTCHCEIRLGPSEPATPTPAELQRFTDAILRRVKESQNMSFRAKMRVVEVTDNGYSDKVKFSALYSNTPEDNSYAKATPSGDIILQIDNPALRGKIKPGQTYYVDFSEKTTPD